MDGFGNQFFPSATFSADQNSNVTPDGIIHQGIHILHFLALADDIIEGIFLYDFSAYTTDFVLQLRNPEYFASLRIDNEVTDELFFINTIYRRYFLVNHLAIRNPQFHRFPYNVSWIFIELRFCFLQLVWILEILSDLLS